MINLTPHPITIRTPDGDVTLPPSGAVARVAVHEGSIRPVTVDGLQVPAAGRYFGIVEGLPEEGVPCIVSSLVLGRVPDRDGVFAPDTGPTAIRDTSGHIVAVTRLVSA